MRTWDRNSFSGGADPGSSDLPNLTRPQGSAPYIGKLLEWEPTLHSFKELSTSKSTGPIKASEDDLHPGYRSQRPQNSMQNLQTNQQASTTRAYLVGPALSQMNDGKKKARKSLANQPRTKISYNGLTVVVKANKRQRKSRDPSHTAQKGPSKPRPIRSPGYLKSTYIRSSAPRGSGTQRAISK